MSRSRKLSYALWSTVAGVASLAGAACGDDDSGGRLPDAPQAGPVATLAQSLSAVAECGVATPPAVSLMVSNTGTSNLVIQSAMADGGFTISTALPVTIAPGANAALAVVPPAAVIGTDRGGSTKAGTLTLTTNEVGGTHTVALAASVRGANIEFTDAAAKPITVMLSGQSGACPTPQAVFIRNTGTAAMTVGVSQSSGFGFDGFSGGVIEPGTAVTQMVRAITTNECTRTQPIIYQVTGTVCGASTAALPATFDMGGTTGCFCS